MWKFHAGEGAKTNYSRYFAIILIYNIKFSKNFIIKNSTSISNLTKKIRKLIFNIHIKT